MGCLEVVLGGEFLCFILICWCCFWGSIISGLLVVFFCWLSFLCWFLCWFFCLLLWLCCCVCCLLYCCVVLVRCLLKLFVMCCCLFICCFGILVCCRFCWSLFGIGFIVWIMRLWVWLLCLCFIWLCIWWKIFVVVFVWFWRNSWKLVVCLGFCFCRLCVWWCCCNCYVWWYCCWLVKCWICGRILVLLWLLVWLSWCIRFSRWSLLFFVVLRCLCLLLLFIWLFWLWLWCFLFGISIVILFGCCSYVWFYLNLWYLLFDWLIF